LELALCINGRPRSLASRLAPQVKDGFRLRECGQADDTVFAPKLGPTTTLLHQGTGCVSRQRVSIAGSMYRRTERCQPICSWHRSAGQESCQGGSSARFHHQLQSACGKATARMSASSLTASPPAPQDFKTAKVRRPGASTSAHRRSCRARLRLRASRPLQATNARCHSPRVRPRNAGDGAFLAHGEGNTRGETASAEASDGVSWRAVAT